MYNRICTFLLVIFMVTLMVPAHVLAAENKPIRAALAYSSIAVLDDKSFVTAVDKGAEKAAKEFGVKLETCVQKENETDRDFIASVAQKDVDVVIAVSFVNVEPLLEAAEEYKNVKFIIIDGVVPPLFNNAKSVIFREHEGSFLVGMIAALKSQTGTIGFVGGRDIPLIRNFASGYRQGAKHVNPKIQIIENMIGTTVQAWDQPVKAEEIALKQISDGADVIFAAAGASGAGVLKAAADKDKFGIGVDSNQNALYPGHVLTSMVKKVDVAVYQALKDLSEGNWDPGIRNLGLKEDAIDYAVDVNNKDLLDPALINMVETARNQIKRGVLEVKIYSPEPKRH